MLRILTKMQVCVQRSLRFELKANDVNIAKLVHSMSWWFTFLSLYCTWRQEAFPLLARIEYILKHGVGECCKWGAQLSSLPQWVFWGQFGIRSRQLILEKLYRILSCPPRDPGWSNSTKICCILAENIPKDMITFDQSVTTHSWRTRRSRGNRSLIKQRESIYMQYFII